MSERIERWQSCYDAGVTNWDLGGPAPPLVRGAAALAPCRAVVVGCGKGHDALALAERGFRVTAVDFAPGAIAAARKAARARKLDVEVLEADVLALPGSHEPWDLWVEHTCFCAIEPRERKAYVEAAARSLVPRGRLLALFHAHPRPGGPPYGSNPEEIRRLFLEKFELESFELEPSDSHPRRAGEEILASFLLR